MEIIKLLKSFKDVALFIFDRMTYTIHTSIKVVVKQYSCVTRVSLAQDYMTNTWYPPVSITFLT